MMKRILGRVVVLIAYVIAGPFACLENVIHRICGRDVCFQGQAQLFSLVPGKIGSCVRNVYYHLTLESCPLNCRFAFGMVFTHSEAVVGDRVYIGANSRIGMTLIGADTMISDGVHVLSGKYQHTTADPNLPFQQQPQAFHQVTIGLNTWIGAGAVVMENVGANCIIGAGSIVTRPIPDGSVAAGNPARPLQKHNSSRESE